MRVDLMWYNNKLNLKYPCEWVYKIIGTQSRMMHDAVAEIVTDTPYRITFSNFSAKGKYICLNVEMTVCSETQRNDIFQSLKKHDAIKMVL
jgi:putative lipoic acid-binding regulatory protein